jgi:hypothetical protein
MAFRLPKLNALIAIVTGAGLPTTGFLRFWNMEVVPAIEAQEAAQQEVLEQQAILIAQQQSQLELINQALELAGLAGGGFSANTIADISYTGWTLGPQVDLTGVVAGDLTIAGTSLQPISATRLGAYPDEQYGMLRVVEVVGGVDTVVYGPAPFITGRDVDPDSIPYILNPATIGTFTDARSTTGAVSYRLDAKMDVTPVEMQDVRFNIQVKRS